MTSWEYGQIFEANEKSNVFKLEEMAYFDEICAPSWSVIRVGSKKMSVLLEFLSEIRRDFHLNKS